jgi:hypothetical protein
MWVNNVNSAGAIIKSARNYKVDAVKSMYPANDLHRCDCAEKRHGFEMNGRILNEAAGASDESMALH